MTAAFFAGCLTATSLGELEWETLAAGFLAILAGFFAFKAAKVQIEFQRTQHQEEIARLQRIDENQFLQEMEVLLIELKHTVKDMLMAIQNKQTLNVREYESDGLNENLLPQKPPTTDENTSLQYNQLRLWIKLLRRQSHVIARADELDTESNEVRQSAIDLVGMITHICEAFPKSNLVFQE
tara:strand:- start:513 stop:1058 length:546 start_codon:yes stop_codon:yes gene_type:complete